MTRTHSGLTRRHLLAGAGAIGAAPLLPSPAAAAQPRAGRTPRHPGDGSMAWLGTSGWRLSAGDHTLLVDPYLTRFPVGLAAGRFDPTTRLRVDEAAVARAVGTPRTVLVTHTHWDHFNDVPHIATTHGARLFGTTTATQLALSYGVPASQLAPVKGGEVLDLGEFVVRVVTGLHSRTAGYSILFPGTRLAPPPRPSTISDLPEGDTLAFLVHRPQGPRVFLMGASDFDDTALGHLEPDVAAVAVPSTRATHEYVPRLLEALGRPRLVIPVHWDNFESPLQNPPRTADPSGEQLRSFVAEVRRVAPASRVLLPKYLERLRLL